MSVPGTISVETIRQRSSAAILAVLAAQGWQESPVVFEQFGSGEGDNLLHKAYAVGCPSTVFMGGRQQVTAGALVETQVVVRWAYNISALDQVTSYDEGLRYAGLLTMAARRITGVTAVILVSAIQAVDDQGWMMGEVTLRVIHLLALN